MKLSSSYRQTLANEIRIAVGHMNEVKTAQEKLYYFSAIFGMANRLMNLEFDPELGFLHHVTNAAYNSMHTTLLLINQGQSMPTFPDNVFEKLQDALNELATYVEKDQKIYPILEKISNIAYSTTGNGYYLNLKGVLKI